MLQAGYHPYETQECDSEYILFMANVLNAEYCRWERLKAVTSSRPQQDYDDDDQRSQDEGGQREDEGSAKCSAAGKK